MQPHVPSRADALECLLTLVTVLLICVPVSACQVFRTYNASITLDKLLVEMEEGGGVGHHGEAYCSRSMEAKKADYDRANKEVRGGDTLYVFKNAL
jgi:hypothetical protein